jgi:hypothetical protein
MKNFANPDIESAAISHFIVNYEVTPPHFHKVTYDLINENVEFMAKPYINQLTANERFRLLNNYGGGNAFYNSAALIYEDFVADLLVRRFHLTRLTDGSSPETTFAPKLNPNAELQTFPSSKR